jgi:autoinducer 2 (AI-2) kinase
MEDIIKDKDAVYRLTGRYPTSLFSALKLTAYRERYPEEWQQAGCFMSISDWAQYMLAGVQGYEHAQASETLLYDVSDKRWSDELLAVFDLDGSLVPPLHFSGTELGSIKRAYALQWGLDPDVPVLAGGADTQLAIKSTRPQPGDVVIVSGTTTPVVKVTTDYILDKEQRSWTNSHLDKHQYILETNCGVTGLNYQRIKDIFYPNESYETIEGELDEIKEPSCFAHLGSLIADDKEIVTRGGFLFDVPIMTALSRLILHLPPYGILLVVLGKTTIACWIFSVARMIMYGAVAEDSRAGT